MKTPIHIGSNLSLPLTFVTQTQAIVAKRRAGKSYTASVQAEELLKLKQPIVVIDITGAWWGLRSSADGKKEGYPIVIAGGEHADMPLEKTAGEVMARAIVEERFSCILDLSFFRKGETVQFLGDFLATLYRLNRQPLHVFADEADYYAPQKPFGNEAVTLGYMDDVVRRGGLRGIGVTLITQRPAVLNKNILTQCEILTTLRLVHPKDIGAIKEWIDVHASEKESHELIASLPNLPIGTAWFWSPGFPDEGGIFQRVAIRKRETFDSGATPKSGEAKQTAKTLAKVDIDRLGGAIRDTVKRAESESPRVLRETIRRLETSLKEKTKVKTERVEVPILSEKDLKALEKLTKRHDDSREALCSELRRVIALLSKRPTVPSVATDREGVRHLFLTPSKQFESRVPVSDTATPAIRSTSGKNRILMALAQSDHPITYAQVAIRAGLSKTSGTFSTYFSNLIQSGLIEGADKNNISITAKGREFLGDFTPLPTGVELYKYWSRELGSGGASRILTSLVEIYPNALTKSQIAERASLSESGTFTTYLSKLRSLELVEKKGDLFFASGDLF